MKKVILSIQITHDNECKSSFVHKPENKNINTRNEIQAICQHPLFNNNINTAFECINPIELFNHSGLYFFSANINNHIGYFDHMTGSLIGIFKNKSEFISAMDRYGMNNYIDITTAHIFKNGLSPAYEFKI
ncbi:MAG: hypothetical protein U0W24_07205 [Bacteroidales bacterium]